MSEDATRRLTEACEVANRDADVQAIEQDWDALKDERLMSFLDSKEPAWHSEDHPELKAVLRVG